MHYFEVCWIFLWVIELIPYLPSCWWGWNSSVQLSQGQTWRVEGLSNGDLHYSIRWKLLCALVANARDSRGGRPTHITPAGSSASCPPPCAARSFWGRKGARAARRSCPFPPISRHEHVPTKGVETWQAGKKSAVKGQERSRSAPVLPCGNYTKKVTGAGNALPFPLSLPVPSPAAGWAQTGPAQGRTLRMSSRDCL